MAMFAGMAAMPLLSIGSALATSIGGQGSSESALIMNSLNPLSMMGGMFGMGGGTSTTSNNSTSNIESMLISTIEFAGVGLLVGILVYVAVKPPPPKV